MKSRATEWVRRLERSGEPAIPTLELYTGNHWFVVRALAAREHEGSPEIRLWVASAGYGLVPIGARLRPYAATFAPGADGIGRVADARRWWELLGQWRGPTPDYPRSLSALAASDPETPLLITASAAYVRAMQPDIERAALQLARPEQLAIVSAGLRMSGDLQAHLVAADARFKHVVGGQMHSLNVRLVEYALDRSADWMPDVQALRRLFSSESAILPALVPHDRDPQSDDAVLGFIRHARVQEPKAGHSVLLRRLRQSGRACEQKRFKKLFLKAIRESHI